MSHYPKIGAFKTDTSLMLRPAPNGGWSVFQAGSPYEMMDELGAYSTAEEMLEALRGALVLAPEEGSGEQPPPPGPTVIGMDIGRADDTAVCFTQGNRVRALFRGQDALDVLDVLEAMEVKKISFPAKLFWEEPCRANNNCWTAKSILGTFSVAHDDDDGWHAELEDDLGWEWEPEFDPRSYDGPITPMRACEDHLNEQIHAALSEPSGGGK